MGCPCSGGIKAWVYTDEKGVSTEKRTEVQALALKVRNGGLGEVKPRK